MKRSVLSLQELEDAMHRTRHSLSSYIYRLVRKGEITEEIFQETWLKVVQNLHTYDQERAFDPWLFRIARNLCLNHLKKEKRQQMKEALLETELHAIANPDAKRSPAREQDREEVALLNLCFDALPLKFREVLHLRFFEEKSLEETAAILEVPVGTVNSRIHRGLNHLKKIWEKRK